ncbi:MAG: polysaccharide deacetylase family protein [Ignavibacteriaceae bacterium]
MIKQLRILPVLLLISFKIAVPQQIAVTFDDAPMRDGEYFTGKERTGLLIEKLEENNVTAAFFCITNHFDSAGTERIKLYADAGHLIANHTHTHSRINQIGVDNYIKDIAAADSILKDFSNFIKWFRYPYLDEGKTIEDRDAFRNALQEMNYINGYVTVDNYDWYINSMLQKALKENRQVDFNKLENFYIEHIWQSIIFYENIAKRTLGRSPAHVLLLHENDLAALFIDKLIQHIKGKGWEIISPVEAYNDEIVSAVPDVLFNGQGRIAAIAYEMGIKPNELVQHSEDTDYLEERALKLEIFK